ncbi:MAG TPA: hypothetical protein ENN46_00330 [Candidatus Woesearchaeota archaeon]|nr:hypothetical protein [Candidatus Woesearchaeota archaeon]
MILSTSRKGCCFILIISVMLVFYSGCTAGPENPEALFKKGYNGVNVRLEYLTAEVFAGEKAPALLTIANNGAYDAFIAGIIRPDETYMRFSKLEDPIHFIEQRVLSNKASLRLPLQGRSVQSPHPKVEATTVNFDSVLPLHMTSKQVKTDIDFCYSYGLDIDAGLCINPRVDYERYIEVCSVRDIIFRDGQGAPVSLDKITMKQYVENVFGREFIVIDMVFHFANKGNGIVQKYTVMPNSEGELYDMCFGITKGLFDIYEEMSPYQSDYARISIDSFKIGNQEMTSGTFGLGLDQDIIRLDENLRGRVRLRLEKTEPYIAAMSIKMSYIYRQVSSASIRIVQK